MPSLESSSTVWRRISVHHLFLIPFIQFTGRAQHLASLAISHSNHHPPLPTSTSHQPRQSNPPSTPTRSQKVRASQAASRIDHHSAPPTPTSHQPHRSIPPSQKVRVSQAASRSNHHSPLPTPTSHQPHRSIPPSTQTRSQKVQHLASPEMARCSGLQSSTPATDSYGCRQTVTRESSSDIPSKPEPTLVWISSDEETGYPDDSEDSEDVGDNHWAPVSAAEVSSDEDEPLPGPGAKQARKPMWYTMAGMAPAGFTLNGVDPMAQLVLSN
ncbi:hypothetical protein EV359DRAFT_88382 [Lentinula novae-zelandiae]|nr:hypothetical protein EV359DRAFT_88382 [Lentinula novae-zelandiae]